MNSRIVKDCFVDAKPKSTKSDEKNFSAKCKFCANKRVSGNLTSSTNFLDHIKVCYCSNVLILTCYLNNKQQQYHAYYVHYVA